MKNLNEFTNFKLEGLELINGGNYMMAYTCVATDCKPCPGDECEDCCSDEEEDE